MLFISDWRRHMRCAFVTVFQTCALPIFRPFQLPSPCWIWRQAFSWARAWLAPWQPGRACCLPPPFRRAWRQERRLSSARVQTALLWRGACAMRQALRQVDQAQARGLQRFLDQGDALAVGAAQVVLGGVGLHHRQVAAHGGSSEEHTSELQSLMRISYAVFCL